MLRRHWIEIAWGCFALANIAIVYEIGHWETIPFHFVWVSLTLVYGLRKWRLGTTVIAMTQKKAANPERPTVKPRASRASASLP